MKPIVSLFVIALVCVVASDAGCVTRNLHITVDNIMELYINGIQITGLPNYNNWQKADVVPLTCYARVIAVKGTDVGVVAGILASTDDGYVMTNSKWKCTNRYYYGWEQLEFDSSTWPAAYQAGIHQTPPWSYVPGIRTDAYWIWTPQFKGGDLVVYCRNELIPLEPRGCPGTRYMSITVDNFMKLYLDGVEQTNLPNANDWTKSDGVPVTCYTEVIAVQGTDVGVIAGILASTPDAYVLTDASWKCTNAYYRGWESVEFDDSAWPQAHVVAIHQTSPWKLVPPIRTDAYWIWTGSQADNVVYCRKRLLPIRKACCC